MDNRAITVLIVIWTCVGLGLCLYLICFPIFMRKKIKVLTDLLRRIADILEEKKN